MHEALVSSWRRIRDWAQGIEQHERSRELVGAMLARQVAQVRHPASLAEVEFRVHSQFGDDGILQWLVARLPLLPRSFVEFGVEDYSESNTRFLMVNNGWRGLVMDGSREKMARLRRRPWFWRHDLEARACFVTRENVNGEIASWAHDKPIGLLHIDVDGNDYWLWDAIHSITPVIVIVEYNAIFGAERAITIPYQADFRRHAAHYSGQYFGASISALTQLANRKGYALIGGNSAGNNAYFVREDFLGDELQAVSPQKAFVSPQFRESRDRAGHLDYLDFEQRQALIRGLLVMNTTNGSPEPF